MRIAGDAPGSDWDHALGYDHEAWTYHPDDPVSLWRDLDAHRYMLDRFFTKLLKLQEAMKTPSGRAMAAHRIAFLHLYLQELQHELTIGGSGYDMRTEVVHRLLRRKYGGEEQRRNNRSRISNVDG
jgi:hypothetical protein